MNLVNLFSDLKKGKVDEQYVALQLNIEVRALRMRMSKWGEKLPAMLRVLEMIRADQVSRSEAADMLGIGVRATNKLAESWGVIRPIKPYIIQRQAAKVKWERHKKYAIDFIAGTMTLEEASEGAELSTRMMRRWVAELIDRHYQMVWKELTKLPLNRRGKLATEIEEAENLTLAQQNVINAISRGDKTLEEEALERVVARRARIHKALRKQGATIVRGQQPR